MKVLHLPVARARRRRHQADDQRAQVAHQARELREQVGELGELTQLRGGAARHVRARHGAEARPGVLAGPVARGRSPGPPGPRPRCQPAPGRRPGPAGSWRPGTARASRGPRRPPPDRGRPARRLARARAGSGSGQATVSPAGTRVAAAVTRAAAAPAADAAPRACRPAPPAGLPRPARPSGLLAPSRGACSLGVRATGAWGVPWGCCAPPGDECSWSPYRTMTAPASASLPPSMTLRARRRPAGGPAR